MPTASTDGLSLHYEVAGDGPTVAFVNEAGLGAWLWGWQHPAVAGPYESLVWDLRGTGRSDAGAPSDYAVDAFAADLEAVLADRGTRRVHIVGAGLGGMVALRYAREYGRAASLALFGTAASGDRVDAALGGLIGGGTGGTDGTGDGSADAEQARAQLGAAFTPEFLASRPDLVDRIVEWRRREDAGPSAARAQVAAARAFEAGPLYELPLPVLVCHGVDDPAVPAGAGEALAADLPRGRFEPVAGRHLCFVEHAAAVNDELLAFLGEHENGG